MNKALEAEMGQIACRCLTNIMHLEVVEILG